MIKISYLAKQIKYKLNPKQNLNKTLFKAFINQIHFFNLRIMCIIQCITNKTMKSSSCCTSFKAY